MKRFSIYYVLLGFFIFFIIIFTSCQSPQKKQEAQEPRRDGLSELYHIRLKSHDEKNYIADHYGFLGKPSFWYTYDHRADLWIKIEHLYIGENNIPALIFTPDLPGKRPVVIFIHGGMGRKESQLWVTHLSFAMNGFKMVNIDMRNHGERGRRIKDLKDIQQAPDEFRGFPESETYNLVPGVLETGRSDVPAVIDYLESCGDADMDRIGITGFSMGGACTWIATASDPRIKAAVPTGAPMWHGTHFSTKSEQISNFNNSAILILVGDNDPLVPLKEAEENYNLILNQYRKKNISEKVSIHVYTGAHEYTGEAFRQANEWFAKWLK